MSGWNVAKSRLMPRLMPRLTLGLALGLASGMLTGCAHRLNQLVDQSIDIGARRPAQDQEGPASYKAYTHYLRALDAERVGDFTQATQSLKKAQEYDPNSATLQTWTGKVLADERQMPEAIAATRKALAMDQTHYQANIQLAGLLQASRQLDEAAAAYLKAIEAAPLKQDAYVELANLYRAQGRAQEGLEVLQLLAERGGEVDARIELMQGALFKDLGQRDKAEASLVSVLDEYPDFVQAQRALVELYLTDGSLKEVTVKLEALFAARPWQDWIPYHLVEMYANLGDLGALETRLSRLADSDRDQAAELRLDAVEVLVGRREYDKAQTILKPLLTAQPPNDVALLYAGYLHARARRYTEALALLEQVPPGSDAYPRALQQRSWVLKQSGKPDQAITILSDYLEKEPDADEVRSLLVGALRDAGRATEALTVVEKLLARRPDDVDTLIQKALVLSDLKRSDEGVTLLRATLQAQPTNVDLFEALSDLLVELGRYDEAIQTLRDALAAQPDRTSVRFRLASCYDRIKRHEEAVAQMQKVLELEPDNAEAMNFIGYSWVEQKVRLEDAERLLKRALELEPDNGYITDSLGWLYFQLGRVKEALPLLERAVAITTPLEAVIIDHLGDAYQATGQIQKAMEAWNRALAVARDQDNPDAALIQALEAKVSGKPVGSPR